MKIEFEINDSDANVLVPALQHAASQALDINTFEVLQKVIQEIQEDIQNGVSIFQQLINYLHPYTNGNPILASSKLIINLGISQNFMESSQGMHYVLSYILKVLVNTHKPGKTPSGITMTEIGKLITIDDCINLIQHHYEKS
ncbi:hypothetical protein J2X69_000012 [Algoriphagus sp. 4150]|uniref:hypothetical protein n=1 Tax=Algoriphagus sp. 4150 TaxID=2817756 RepID=UPI00285F4567|nr:hypothetical protein [Algoriphagus sp. 4150]MDR7127684.1 hypothetical protein [Algoriphagus sp. 4150]